MFYETYTEPFEITKLVSEIIQYNMDELKRKYDDEWVEKEKPFVFDSETQVRIKITYDSSETLRIYPSITSAYVYSYDTQNVYYGDPVHGAICLGNLSEVIKCSPLVAEKLAEHFAFKGDPSDFKLKPNTNLLAALVGGLEKKEKDYTVESRFNTIDRRYGLMWQSINRIEDSCSVKNKFELTLSQLRDSWNETIPNSLVMAIRHPDIADVIKNRVVFKEEAKDFWRSFGVKLPDVVDWVPYEVKKRYKNATLFLKNASVLKRWCSECK